MAEALRRDAHVVTEIRCSEADGAERAALAHPLSTLIVDELELADPPLLEALDAHVLSGGPLLSALDTGHWRSHHLLAGSEGSGLPPNAQRLLDTAHLMPIDPMDAHELETLLHSHSETAVDSDTVHTICALAEGRPQWALDLLTIARHGHLSSCPRPSISGVLFGAVPLPAARSLSSAIGDISAELASMAVALADFESRDLSAVVELIGGEAAHQLLDLGVLIRTPGTELYSVPPFVGFSLHHRADPSEVSRIQNLIAGHLVTQEALGFPITAAEAAQCARVLGTWPVATDGALSPVESRIIQRVAADLLAFDEGSAARTLLVRAGTTDHPEDPLHRTKSLIVLAGPAAGLRELDALSFPDGSSDAVAAAFLRAQLVAAVGGHTDIATGPVTDDLAAVFRVWNTLGRGPNALSGDPGPIQSLGFPELTNAARAFSVLDHVLAGVVPDGTWLATGEDIPLPTVEVSRQFEPLLATTLLAHTVVALLSGECASRSNELREAAGRLAPRAYHRRWIRHLEATGTALASGDLGRARLEWSGLQARAPRFIPVRLRDALDRIALAITEVSQDRTVGSTAPVGIEIERRIVSYLSGQIEHVPRRPFSAGPATPLPSLRLAEAHLAASEEQNPAELLRIAEELQRRELWTPAAFAYTEARAILLSRRASGGVRRCDARIAEFTARLRQRVRWHRPGDLPTSSRVRLTPRERSVARLAAQGMTNRQIAERLGCSARTVESHLAQARSKLGASSRDQIAELLS
ncbi:helix-turn-helix transcriptional regulator [Leucobacter rhizosphaerae]|uniref:Helix-turn-helix transcriptional regulator n=1 Tax=Leucobacter rhizosphaerae TaxID=2932245 RepID=A0ABY4FX08_9MICO|nr:helix-turn-helix transcriptional regulator [Leucobacter rhizosphaerae]UOQ60843.1 helix-turn-helix transcriptional regulator [Leucobacter rhizosphaerae]